MPATTAHPSSAALLAYGQGRLDAGEMAQIETHLAECSTCCEALASTPDDTLLIRAREAATSGFRAREQTVSSKPANPREIPQALREHPRYRVLGLLGAGGMGAVYKAEHRMMERLVALKVINPAFVSSPAALERFEREVKTAAKLSHPNIVAAHDADQAGDLHFLVMEFVEGMSLDRLVASKGPLPWNVAANLMYQAALGLQHAHEKGMIHRDIKPQNLMRARDGSVKILDFGLARLASQALQSAPGGDESAAPERPADATRAGSLLGTPDYIAPEQATDAHGADIRADIYSLGCTLYFLLTGEPPYAGGTLLDKLHAHKMCEPTPIRVRRPEVPEELAAVLERMLAKNPADRYARPADLAKALKPIAQSRVATPPPEAAPPESFPLDLAATPLPVVSKSPPKARSGSKKSAEEISPLLKGIAGIAAVPMIAACVWLISGAFRNNGTTPNKNELAQQQEQVAQGNSKSSRMQQGNAQGVGKGTDNPQNKSGNPAATKPLKVLMLLPQKQLFEPDYKNVRDNLPRSVQLVTAAERKEQLEFLRFPGDRTPAPVIPNLALADDVKAEDYAAIIFVGGSAPELCTGTAARHVKRLLDEFKRQNKPVCAICAGQDVPAFHGLFSSNRIVAGGPHVKDFPQASARRQDNGEVDNPGNPRLITAATADDGERFAWLVSQAIGAKYP